MAILNSNSHTTCFTSFRWNSACKWLAHSFVGKRKEYEKCQYAKLPKISNLFV